MNRHTEFRIVSPLNAFPSLTVLQVEGEDSERCAVRLEPSSGNLAPREELSLELQLTCSQQVRLRFLNCLHREHLAVTRFSNT